MSQIDQELREELEQLHADVDRALTNQVIEQLEFAPPCVGWPNGECEQGATVIVSCRSCMASAFFCDSCIEKLRSITGTWWMRRSGRVFECNRCLTHASSFDKGYSVSRISGRA